MPLQPGQAVAIFDIGSNAVRLTGYRLHPDGTIEQILKRRELCEMGRPHDRDGYLYPAGVARARKTIAQYCDLIHDSKYAFSGIIAVATEAVRRAKDGPDFVARLKSENNLNVRVLSEDEEGLYGARGVLRDISNANGIVADLGGGSLQLTHVENDQTSDTRSFPLGGLRLLGAHNHLDDFIHTHLNNLPDTLSQTDQMYVIGSWRGFAELYQKRAGIAERDLQGVIMDPAMIAALTDWLFHQPASDMQKILINEYGFESSRAELMPYGAYLLRHLIKLLKVKTVVVSSSGIRDGILQAILDGGMVLDPLPKAT